MIRIKKVILYNGMYSVGEKVELEMFTFLDIYYILDGFFFNW